MRDLKDFHNNLEAKINIQNNIDNFAIEFAEWISDYNYLEFKGWYFNTYEIEMEIFKSTKELLQIFKVQRR